jgi:hypothetical protein
MDKSKGMNINIVDFIVQYSGGDRGDDNGDTFSFVEF